MRRIRFICFVALCALFALASCTRGAARVQAVEGPENSSPAETINSNGTWERVLSGSLYPQDVTITVVAENVDPSVIFETRRFDGWVEYDEVVDRDMREINSRNNFQYTEWVFGFGAERPREETEKLFFIEELFIANFSDWERNAVYRLTFIVDNTSYVVYTARVGIFSFMAFFRIFTRTIE